MKKITEKHLEFWRACAEQRILFQALFPEGAELSEENWEKAIAAKLDVLWLSRRLGPKQLRAYLQVEQGAAAECSVRCTELNAELFAEHNEALRLREAREIGNEDCWRRRAAASEKAKIAAKPHEDRLFQRRAEALFPLLVQTFQGDAPCQT